MQAEVVFVGRHIYERRILFDGYSIDDVVLQIVSAMADSAVIRMSQKMTALQSTQKRSDGYGNDVTDEAVLECTGKYPRPELYSVIPKGDDIKPGPQQQTEKGRDEATPSVEVLTNPPG